MAALLDSTARHLRRTALAKQRDGPPPRPVRRGLPRRRAGLGRRDRGRRGGRRPGSDGRRPVPGRVQHQDLHRGDGHAAARRGPARARRPARRPRARGVPPDHDPAVPRARVGDGPRAARRRVGDPRAARRQDAAPRLRRRRAGRPPARPLALLQRRLRDARPARRGARRPVVGGVAAHPSARPARDAAYVGGLRRRAARHRLLRRAVRRRAPAGAGDGPQGDGSLRRSRQHRPRPRALVGVRRGPRLAAVRRTRWRRCASRRCSSTPTSGPARWVSASS